MHSRATTSPFLGHPSFSTPTRPKSHAKSLFSDLEIPKSPSYLLTESTFQTSSLHSPIYRYTDLPYLDSPQHSETREKLGNWMARNSLKLAQKAFEVLKEETIVTKLAAAFYGNHLKQVAFRVWREGGKLRKLVGRVGNGVRKLAFGWWRYRARDKTNRTKAYLHRLQQAFDVLKSTRIAALTISKRRNRMRKGLFQQWKRITKETKADRLYTKLCFSHWLQAIQIANYIRNLLLHWHTFTVGNRQRRTQRKVRNRAAASSMRERREERGKRAVIREIRRIVTDMRSRRKKIRLLRRKNEEKCMKNVFDTWKNTLKHNFSAYIRSKTILKSWKKVTSVLNKGKLLQEMVKISQLRGIIKEIRSLSTSKMLYSVKLSKDFNQTRLKAKSFQSFQQNALKNKILYEKSGKKYEKTLKSTAFEAFLSVYHRKIILANVKIEQNNSQYRDKRVIFAELRSFAGKSSYIRTEKYTKWLQRRALWLLFAWRKRTIEGQIEDEQLVVNFRVRTLAKLAFQSISMLTWSKRLIRFKRSRISRFLHLWKEVNLRKKALFPYTRKTRVPDKARERRAEGKLREIQRILYWKRWKFALWSGQICEVLWEKRNVKNTMECWQCWVNYIQKQSLIRTANHHFTSFHQKETFNSWKRLVNLLKIDKKVKITRLKVAKNFRLERIFPIFRKAVSCKRIIEGNLHIAQEFRMKMAFHRFLLQIAFRKETGNRGKIAENVYTENSKRRALRVLKGYMVKLHRKKGIDAAHNTALLSHAVAAFRLHNTRQKHYKAIRSKHLKSLLSAWISKTHISQLLKGNRFTQAISVISREMPKQRTLFAREWRQRRLQLFLLRQWRFQCQFYLAVKSAGKSLNL